MIWEVFNVERAALYIPLGVETLIDIIAHERFSERSENRRPHEANFAFGYGLLPLNETPL